MFKDNYTTNLHTQKLAEIGLFVDVSRKTLCIRR